MDSFEFNKMAGAVLGTLLFLMGLGIFSDALFAVQRAAKPGYDLPAAEESKGGATAAVATAEPLPVLLAKADAKKGENLIKACATCHTFDAAGSVKPTGPNLYGVVNRKIGSTGYAYSDNMKSHGGNWDYESLNKFITNPKGFVANTKMSYAGEKDAGKRADIIAYLRSLAASPAPLPNP
ncbi:MAG: Cytochrome c [Pseudomonadota bacterium]|jgi:cytochrome c